MTTEYLNSWSNDWIGTTAADQSAEHMPTFETIRKAMREFKEKWKDVDLGPDVWVLTHAEMQELKQHCEKRDPPITSLGIVGWESSIYGIRIESFPTRREVFARVLELADKGVKAGFLANEGEKQ